MDLETEQSLISNVCPRYRVASTETGARLIQAFLRTAAFQTREEKRKKALALLERELSDSHQPVTWESCGMGFGLRTFLTYKEVTHSASVSPQAIAHGSGDTTLALVRDCVAVHASKDFVPVTDAWLPAQALVSGCPSSALCDRAAPSPTPGTIHVCPHVKGTLALLPGVSVHRFSIDPAFFPCLTP